MAPFLIALIGQVIGGACLPLTQGFSNLRYTAVVVVSFVGSLGILARMIHQGAALSLLAPLMSAAVPLILVLIAVFLQGEAASILKLLTLVAACGLIGFAATLS